MRSRGLTRGIELVFAALAACGGAGCGASRTAPPPAFAISPNPAKVAAKATRQFTVSPSLAVTWSVTEVGGPPPASRSHAYPLKVSADGRYLVDQNDQPWRVQADAAWLMSTNATPAEVDTYLATRKAQGFNAFYLMAMVHPGGYATAPHAPDNANGDPPFATPGVFSTAAASPASRRYWGWIDSIVDKAAARGMVVMLAYTYLGYAGGDQGWYRTILAQPSRQACNEWGRWLGNRYKDKANVVWFALGDYSPPTGSEGSLRVREIIHGIKAAGARQLFMAEASSPDSLPTELSDFASLLDQDSFYGYGPRGRGQVYETADRSWTSTPTKPGWMQEGTYEYENNTGTFSGQPWETRRGRFWSVLAGGTAGDGFGSREAWQWQNIPASLSTPGADYSELAFRLFASLPWWGLRPSGTRAGYAGKTLITSGQGRWGRLDYITSALSSGGDWLLAYVPAGGNGARTFSVDMSAMAAPSQARWFDPGTGSLTSISSGHELPNAGTRSFTTPGSRADSTNDWLLVLDTAGTARCGRITPSGLYTAPSSAPAGVRCLVDATLQSAGSAVAHASVDLR